MNKVKRGFGRLPFVVTAKTQYKLTNAKEYFEEHLCVGDYYDEGQRVTGQWFGSVVVSACFKDAPQQRGIESLWSLLAWFHVVKEVGAQLQVGAVESLGRGG